MRTFILVGFFLAGCHIDPCDPGQTKVQNSSCVPDMPSSSGGGPSSDAGSGDETGDAPPAAGSAANCSQTSRLGDVCADSADCQCLTDLCAIPPGETIGSCTRTGCADDPSVCPAGF
jgi:hypothetical protein